MQRPTAGPATNPDNPVLVSVKWNLARSQFAKNKRRHIMPHVPYDLAYGLGDMSPATIMRQRIAHIIPLQPHCVLANGSKVTLAQLLAAHISVGDDVSFPLPDSSTATAEILVAKNSLAGSGRDVYQAPIRYVT